MCPNVPPRLIDPLFRTGVFDLRMAKGNEIEGGTGHCKWRNAKGCNLKKGSFNRGKKKETWYDAFSVGSVTLTGVRTQRILYCWGHHARCNQADPRLSSQLFTGKLMSQSRNLYAPAVPGKRFEDLKIWNFGWSLRYLSASYHLGSLFRPYEYGSGRSRPLDIRRR
jgi:hypothetical protein